jgi:hypothetical protein
MSTCLKTRTKGAPVSKSQTVREQMIWTPLMAVSTALLVLTSIVGVES